MRPVSSFSRVLRLLALLVQVALPAAGGIADAHLEVDSLARVHVESATHDCDERGHPELCAICHFLRTTPASPATHAAVGGRDGNSEPPSADVVLDGIHRHSPSLPRGPPTLG